jgi:hypothetical protein
VVEMQQQVRRDINGKRLSHTLVCMHASVWMRARFRVMGSRRLVDVARVVEMQQQVGRYVTAQGLS